MDIHLGVTEYVTENSIITEDIYDDRLISNILLIAKVSIHTAKIGDKSPHFISFKDFASLNNKEE